MTNNEQPPDPEQEEYNLDVLKLFVQWEDKQEDYQFKEIERIESDE